MPSRPKEAPSQATPASRSPASKRRAASAAATMAQVLATLGSHNNSRARTGTSSSLSRSFRLSSEVAAPRDGPPEASGLVGAVTGHSTKCNRNLVSASILARRWAAPGLAQEIGAQPVLKVTDQILTHRGCGGQQDRSKPSLPKPQIA